MTRAATLALLCVLAMSLAIPLIDPASAAAAAQQRRVCKRAGLYNTPRGYAVSFVRPGDRVSLLRRSHNRRWVHVRIFNGTVGWLSTGALCRG